MLICVDLCAPLCLVGALSDATTVSFKPTLHMAYRTKHASIIKHNGESEGTNRIKFKLCKRNLNCPPGAFKAMDVESLVLIQPWLRCQICQWEDHVFELGNCCQTSTAGPVATWRQSVFSGWTKVGLPAEVGLEISKHLFLKSEACITTHVCKVNKINCGCSESLDCMVSA